MDSDGSGELEFSELRLLLQALGKEFTDAELRDQCDSWVSGTHRR